MANYLQELAQNAECQSHTGRLTRLWFLPKLAQGLNTNQSIIQLYSSTYLPYIVLWSLCKVCVLLSITFFYAVL
jgi:hypothetical protein